MNENKFSFCFGKHKATHFGSSLHGDLVLEVVLFGITHMEQQGRGLGRSPQSCCGSAGVERAVLTQANR